MRYTPNNLNKIQVTIPADKVKAKDRLTGICHSCGKKRKTTRHHWFYVFTMKQVKAKPELALLFTEELCFPCHRAANAMTLLDKFPAHAYATLRELFIRAKVTLSLKTYIPKEG